MSKPADNETASTFEHLLEAAPDAMVGVDVGGRVVFANSQAELLLLTDVVTPGHSAFIEKPFNAADLLRTIRPLLVRAEPDDG